MISQSIPIVAIVSKDGFLFLKLKKNNNLLSYVFIKDVFPAQSPPNKITIIKKIKLKYLTIN